MDFVAVGMLVGSSEMGSSWTIIDKLFGIKSIFCVCSSHNLLLELLTYLSY
jgi:hypothetical protein